MLLRIANLLVVNDVIEYKNAKYRVAAKHKNGYSNGHPLIEFSLINQGEAVPANLFSIKVNFFASDYVQIGE